MWTSPLAEPADRQDPGVRPRAAARDAAGALAWFWTKVGSAHALEGGLIFAVLMLVEWVTPGRATLAQLAPHPFWIPVILMTVQKGSASGLAAAAVATGLAWVAGWPDQTTQEDFYTYSMHVWHEPILWIIAALVIGSLRNRQIRERDALDERLRLTEEQRNTLGSYCSELQAELAAFERARATASNCPVTTALDVLQDLRTHGAANWLERLSETMTCWLGPAQWSLLLVRGGALHAVAGGAGWRADHVVTSLSLARLHAAARAQARPLSVFDGRDVALLDGLGILACDVPAADRSESLGLLIVSRVEPIRLTPAAPAALAIIAEAVGARLSPAAPIPASVQDGPLVLVVAASKDCAPCVT